VQEQRGGAAAAFEGPHGPLEIRLTSWFESRPATDSNVSTSRTMRLGTSASLCEAGGVRPGAALAETASRIAAPIRIILATVFAKRLLPPSGFLLHLPVCSPGSIRIFIYEIEIGVQSWTFCRHPRSGRGRFTRTGHGHYRSSFLRMGYLTLALSANVPVFLAAAAMAEGSAKAITASPDKALKIALPPKALTTYSTPPTS
jgi:hypothetical protein